MRVWMRKVCALVTGLALVAGSVVPAGAPASALARTPISAQTGSVAQISGSNWPPGTPIFATVGGVAVTGPPVGAPQASTTGAGVIPSGIVVRIPGRITAGMKELSVTVGAASASVPFEEPARPLTISPTSGPPGTQVAIAGTGMTPSGTIAAAAFLIDDAAWPDGVTPISRDGTFTITLTIGSGTTTVNPGDKNITVTDSGGRVASGIFTIAAQSITLTPTSGVSRSTVKVDGLGFPLSSTVTLTWGNVDTVPISWGRTFTDGLGRFTFSAPNLSLASASAASVLVQARAPGRGGTVVSATANYTVPGSAITVSPTSVAPGSIIIVSGTGFSPFVALNAITIGAAVAAAGGVKAADANGQFSLALQVPGLPPGSTNITIGLNVAGAPGVSVPVTILPVAGFMANLFALLLDPGDPNLIIIWAYNPSDGRFLLYDPAAPLVSDLRTLEIGKGYWILVRRDTVVGLGSGTYTLKAGWTNIGWLG